MSGDQAAMLDGGAAGCGIVVVVQWRWSPTRKERNGPLLLVTVVIKSVILPVIGSVASLSEDGLTR